MCEPPRVALFITVMAGYDRLLLRGIGRYVRYHGPWVMFCPGTHPFLPLPVDESCFVAFGDCLPMPVEPALPDIRRLRATGLIGRVQSARLAKTLLKLRTPTVAMDLSEEQLGSGDLVSRFSEVRPNSEKAGRLAAEHFLDHGFRHFAFCGYPRRVWSRRRQDGFLQRLTEAGFTPEVYEPAHAEPSLAWHQEQAMLTSWLKSLPKPVGVMACNDGRGRQVLEACKVGQMTVPDEVSVVGVDDDQLFCELVDPSLSSVALDGERAGYQAAELLDGLMSGQITEPQCIEADALWVVNRRSTDVVAVDDVEVSAALRFIRDNSRRPIGVNDVAKQIAISRRTLERHFHRVLNRSIRDEIERVRIEKTKQLLVETAMPLWKVAELSGFGSLSYLSRLFHQRMGRTLAQYRQEHSVDRFRTGHRRPPSPKATSPKGKRR